jgi:ribonuclease P protein component
MTGGKAGLLRLTRTQRLHNTRDFARIRANGQRLVHGCLIANWMMDPQGKTARLGVITGRTLGGATVRNRARRLIREVFRHHQHEFIGAADLILIARPSIVNRSRAAVETDLIRLMCKAGLLPAHS